MADQVHVAVVGMGCRFPGGASNPTAFWRLLEEGRDAVIPVPEDRWDIRRFLSSETPCPSGKTYLKEGGFLRENLLDFDPGFFSISPREAESLDPQQRLMLEVSYEALEDAGFRVEKLRRHPVGVFVGAFTLDNMGFRTRRESRGCIESSDAMGFSMTLLANRLSHAYDWIGPSMAIDTACSSSLVAIHEACRSIQDGECEMALAGGVNVILGPDSSTAMSRGGFLSPRCRSRAFDRSADGYARGEGAGVVLLKPLHKAEEEGDFIHAVIRGSGINQDGKTAGIALPNPESQKRLMREVYANSEVSPGEVRFVEAHGTGTAAGDRIELGSIRSVFSPTPSKPLFVSSVKTNIGHLEAAAGIAGFIKTILCLKHRKLPRHLHLEDPVSELAADTGLICPTEPRGISEEEGTLLAGINSFGYGGTNAHVVLQEAPVVEAGDRDHSKDSPSGSSLRELVRISARSKEALRQMAGEHADWLESHPHQLENWKHTVMHHRSRHRFGLTLPASQPSQAAEALHVFASSGQPDSDSMSGHLSEEASPIVFVCTGMGPQWWAMGRELFDADPDFTQAFDDCDKAFRALSGWSIRDELLADEENSRMIEPEVAQPANFCLQVALAALWKGWGISPDAIVGHSVGEVASAFLSGALSLEQAIMVSFHRSRLQQTLRGTGGMLAVGIGEEEIVKRIENLEEVSLAAINSPSAATLAGEVETLEKLAREWEEEGVFQRMLPVDVPYHSVKMDAVRQEFRSQLELIEPSPTTIPLYSTVTGDLLHGDHCGVGYWWSNLRMPVRFDPAIRKLLAAGYRSFLEIGPHPVLARSIREIAEEEGCEIQTFASLRKGEPGTDQVKRTRGSLDMIGHELPMPSRGQVVSLPAYPWQKERFWRASQEAEQDSRGRPGAHVFLQESGRNAVASWETEWNRLFFPYLDDHVVVGEVVWPGAAYLEAGLALNLELNNGKPATLERIRFERLLRWEPDRLQCLSTRIDPVLRRWTVACRSEGSSAGWVDHASGLLSARPLTEEPEGRDLNFAALLEEGFEFLDVESFYSRLRSMGLDYGASFRGVNKVCRKGRIIYAEIKPANLPDFSSDQYQIHPAILDAVFQSFAAAAFDHPEPETWIPAEVGRMHFFRKAGRSVTAGIEISLIEKSRIVGKAFLQDTNGRVVALLEEVVFRRAPRIPGEGSKQRYHPVWEEAPLEDEPEQALLRGSTLLILPPEPQREDMWDRLKSSLPGEVIVCRWNEGTGEGDLLRVMTNSLSISKATSVAQVVFVAGGKKDEYGEESLWALVQLIRSDLWSDSENKAPTLTVATSGVFLMDGNQSEVDLSAAATWGAGSVIANERPSIPLRLIDLSPDSDEATIAQLARELSCHITRREIRFERGSRWIRYWRPDPTKPVIPELETIEVPHDSDTRLLLSGTRGAGVAGVHHVRTKRRFPDDGEIEIRVETAGLNFKDLLKVTGQIPPQALEGTFFGDSLGLECSGVVERVGNNVHSVRVGDRVAAFSREGCLGSHIVAANDFVFPLPDDLSFEDGACLVPWVTAWYSLQTVAQLQAGESVLIHAAAGGVGLAALQVAKANDAIVFATASSEEKRSLLREHGADHVLDSSTLEFAGDIRRITNGRGIDVVLNSLSGDALQVSFDLLAPYGRFIEIGKRDIIENRSLPMDVFNRNASFISIDLDRVLLERAEKIRDSLKGCFEKIASRYFTPLPCQTLPASKAVEAFRLLGDRTRIGRINLQYANHDAAVAIEEKHTQIRPDAAYLVTGGTGGLGLSIAKWLVEQGAGKLVLLSRSGLSSEAARGWQNSIEEEIEILAPPTDVSEPADMEAVFEEIHARGWQLAGVFHCALELEDRKLEEVDRDSIRRVFAAKVRGGFLLESLLEGEAELDFWVAFSSISTLLGNPGQGTYVAANTWLEQLAESRHQRGKPAMALLLGYLGDTGVASRSPEIIRHLEMAGLREMNSKRVAKGILELFDLGRPVQGFFDLDWKSWEKLSLPIADWHRFSRLVSARAAEEMEARFQELKAEVEALEPEQRNHYIESRITGLLSETLSIPADRIDTGIPISQLGIDSLMAMEFLTAARDTLGLKFSESEFANDPTVSDLRREVLSRIVPKTEGEPREE